MSILCHIFLMFNFLMSSAITLLQVFFGLPTGLLPSILFTVLAENVIEGAKLSISRPLVKNVSQENIYSSWPFRTT